jgi:nucleotide-binding universal stress UspA family protein
LIVGSHSRTAVEHWLLGSVAEHVVRHARIPVLLVPPNPPPSGAQS